MLDPATEALLRSLSNAWCALNDASVSRAARLLSYYETHKFVAQVRDLLGWTQTAMTEMAADQPVRDLQTAEWLAGEHQRLRAEMEGREAERKELAKAGRRLGEEGHCVVEEVALRLEQLREAFDAVRKEWTLREEWLEQVRAGGGGGECGWMRCFERGRFDLPECLIHCRFQTVQWHALQRENSQVLSLISVKCRALDALAHRSGQNAASKLRELNTFVRALGSLGERVERLAELAREMARRGHMEAKGCRQLAKRVSAGGGGR